MFGITPFHAYADDNQIIETSEILERLIEDTQRFNRLFILKLLATQSINLK